MNRILLGATALILTVPAMAQTQGQAQPQPRAQSPLSPQWQPASADGSQSRDQAAVRVREHFEKMDKNRDGFVAGDEMQSMRGHHMGQGQGMRQMGERRGRGGDRLAMRDPAQAFEGLDANRDGMLSRDEFARLREIRQERRIVQNGKPGDAMKSERRGQRMGGQRMGGMMRMSDLDRDGRVSLQEATTSALQRFDRIDTNRDGRITPDERRQHREHRKALRAQRAG